MGTTTLLNLLGAAALLLWGLRMVRTGVTRILGGDMRRWLAEATRNRFLAMGAGTGVTLLLQSSAATALLTAAFASRGMIETAPALAVMLGADVGTALVAQALSFDLRFLSPLLLFLGFLLFQVSESSTRRNIGRVGIGLGLILLALRLIVAASEPVRESETLLMAFGALESDVLLAILIGALITWIAHSSLAIILTVATLAAAGALSADLALMLVLGANLGGAIVPLLAAMGEGPGARRVAFGNLIARAVGVAAAAATLPWIRPYVAALDPDPIRQVVNFHLAFNMALASVFIFLTGPLAALVRRLAPDAPPAVDDPGRARHLDRSALGAPKVALAAAEREAVRMADIVETMLRRSINALRQGDRAAIAEIEKLDDQVDALHEAIKLYLIEISREALDAEESRRCAEIMTFTVNLEHVGDIVDKNLLELAAKKAKKQLRFSPEGLAEIVALHARVLENLQVAMGVFLTGDAALARRLLADKERVRALELEAADNHLERLRSGKLESIETSTLHLDVVRDLKRINSHLTSVAYPILDAKGELRPTRLRSPAPKLGRGQPAE